MKNIFLATATLFVLGASTGSAQSACRPADAELDLVLDACFFRGRLGTGDKVQPSQIAAEISVALICTAMGLATAIPLGIYNFTEGMNNVESAAAAVLERERQREALLRWMKTTPLILAPVGSTPAFEHGARRVTAKGESISVFRAFSYSQTFNVFGLPSAVVPAGRSIDGLPIGVQIVGRPFDETTVLAAAAIVEGTHGGIVLDVSPRTDTYSW